ncbi:hypothetical protein J6590_089969 [Homalodisca vitripennis]|nr:hypothetical protein J6590_089969 [Homalodisca vitripennis]
MVRLSILHGAETGRLRLEVGASKFHNLEQILTPRIGFLAELSGGLRGPTTDQPPTRCLPSVDQVRNKLLRVIDYKETFSFTQTGDQPDLDPPFSARHVTKRSLQLSSGYPNDSQHSLLKSEYSIKVDDIRKSQIPYLNLDSISLSSPV